MYLCRQQVASSVTHLTFWAGSLTGPGAHWSGRMVNQPQVPSISVPRVLGLQLCVVTLAGDLNSGSHACMASTFPRSHLPTPLSAVFPTAEGQHRAGESKAVSIHYTACGSGKAGKCAESKKAPELELGTRGHWGGGAPGRTALHLQLTMFHERISPPLVRSSRNFRSLKKRKISTGENDRGKERHEPGERLAGSGEWQTALLCFSDRPKK